MKEKIIEQKIIDEINKQKGTPGYWPGFDYNVVNSQLQLIINIQEKDSGMKSCLRSIDPWSLVLTEQIRIRFNYLIKEIVLIINCEDVGKYSKFNREIEALKRRLSFLQLNNPSLLFKLLVNHSENKLYSTISELFNRPDNEIIKEASGKEDAEDTPGRLEKDFQAYLFGKGLEGCKDIRTNERLAVIGEHFLKVEEKKLPIMREFATGVFDRKVSRDTRLLPTEYIDIVSINKYGQVAIVELKVNDSKLDVISQILNYALYFRCYQDKLYTILENHPDWENKIRKKGFFCCYFANNYFHPKLVEIKKYYKINSGKYGFQLLQITLGATEEW